jgi:hypothetical protein
MTHRGTTASNDAADLAGVITRREAIQRVTALLGGLTLVGGSGLLTACERERPVVAAAAPIGQFTVDDIAFLDEVADTILPDTKSPGAKAAKTGAFMALMVTDQYEPKDQVIFRNGMKTLDDACRAAHGVGFMQATPQQRLSFLETLDREQKAHTDARDAARRARPKSDTTKTPEGRSAERFLPDQRKEGAPKSEAGAAVAIAADTPAHYFRMMKELTIVGYVTSEIGCTQALRYVESPGRFDPCVPYAPGEKAWAGHA